jgi:hypothetical protein
LLPVSELKESAQYLKFFPAQIQSTSQVPPSTSAHTTAKESSPSTMDATQRPVLATLNRKRAFVGPRAKLSPVEKRIDVEVQRDIRLQSLAAIAMAYPTPSTIAPKAAAAVRMFGPGEFECSGCNVAVSRACSSNQPPSIEKGSQTAAKFELVGNFEMSLNPQTQVPHHRLLALDMTSAWLYPRMLCRISQSR